jgi:cold shock CspA family protein
MRRRGRNQEIFMEREIATIKLTKPAGFGFLIREGGAELFFHRSRCIPPELFEQLRSGDQVQFGVGDGRRGPEAVDVRKLT